MRIEVRVTARPNESEALRIATNKYEDAVNSGDCSPAGIQELRRAERAYASILLREDKVRRPEVYRK